MGARTIIGVGSPGCAFIFEPLTARSGYWDEPAGNEMTKLFTAIFSCVKMTSLLYSSFANNQYGSRYFRYVFSGHNQGIE